MDSEKYFLTYYNSQLIDYQYTKTLMKIFFDKLTDLLTSRRYLGRKLREKCMSVATSSVAKPLRRTVPVALFSHSRLLRNGFFRKTSYSSRQKRNKRDS